VNDRLYINLGREMHTVIEIYSVLGKKVFETAIQDSQVLQLDGLSAGIYIIRLTQDNQTISKKLIKQ
ncbi:MAG TPA: T9SS type A sorting domain-containing protein, partial [Aquaticitalea sp.]|nr:T9SS type A sorting domain-containing protein [Aquaticitalea sp.]